VQTRLSGQLQRPDGTVAAGPPTRWKGLNKPYRTDRRWAKAWSPEQISQRLLLDYPDDENMRISHEAIYQALYIEGRGALKRELVACLRTGRALRKPQERTVTSHRGTSPQMSSPASDPPRPKTGQSPATGKATSSSASTARQSAPSSSAPCATRCWCTYPALRAKASSHPSRTDRPWAAMARSP
jgi:hypothetical protein